MTAGSEFAEWKLDLLRRADRGPAKSGGNPERLSRYAEAAAGMKNLFLSAAVLACTLQHVTAPKTHKKLWLIHCQNDQKKVLLREQPRTLAGAKRAAHRWLDPQVPKSYTVTLQALRHEQK